MCGVGLVMLGWLCLVGCIRLSGLVGQAWLVRLDSKAKQLFNDIEQISFNLILGPDHYFRINKLAT